MSNYWNKEYIDNLKFNKIELKLPVTNDNFELYINTDNNICYKKIKNNNLIKDIKKYKELIFSLKNNTIINKYIYDPYKINIEDDGSYYSMFINNTIRLYDININSKIDKDILIKIKSNIKELYNYIKLNNISGDWALHNIVYCLDNEKIYNINLEGFYIYSLSPDNYEVNYNTIFEEKLILIEKLINNSNNSVLNVIKYIKEDKKSYSGCHKSIGYHSIEIDNIYYKGQRDCVKRLDFCKKYCDFSNKNILDIGCCIGGMLFPLSSEINYGCGIDYNPKNINAGNIIKQYKKIDNLSFYVFDLDKEELNFILNFMQKIDIVFLYSICMWIKKWKELINFISMNSNILFIETNGSEKEQLEQITYCKSKYNSVKLLYEKSLDDEIQQNRKLYICTNI
jgi:hypothetical protein